MLTQTMIDKYGMNVHGSKGKVNRTWGMSAKSSRELPKWARGEIRKGNRSDTRGIGDYFTPTSGELAGIPVFVRGFTCDSIEPVKGLPVGKVHYLIVTTLYKNGMTTGLEIRLPIKEA